MSNYARIEKNMKLVIEFLILSKSPRRFGIPDLFIADQVRHFQIAISYRDQSVELAHFFHGRSKKKVIGNL
jgi:hypothetical protein